MQAFEAAARPLLPGELYPLMKAAPEQTDAINALMEQLVTQGKLVSLKGGRFGLPEKMNLVHGELSVHPDGFGFVTPETGGRDIYLTAVNLKEAWHGDRVVVRIEGRRGSRQEGKVIRVLERRHKEILGLLCQADQTYYVEPEDEHLIFNLVIPPEQLASAEAGDMVRAAVANYPTGHLNPQGVILEVLGSVEDAAVQTRLVILKYGLPDEFPPEVLAAAEQISLDMSPRVLKDRLDLRELPMVTIDGETARDFDDGVYVEKKPGGTYTLYVAIADVSHYVAPGSILDREAERRGNSVYFPQRAVHMLPEQLATDICSLRPDVDRLAVVVILDYDRTGKLKRFHFARAVIRNHARLTYLLVHRLLTEKDRALRQQYRPFLKMLGWMEELRTLLRDRRGERGSLLMSIPEAEVVLDDKGWPVDIRRVDSLLSHQIIEEFMIAANEAVAVFLGEPSLLRVHEPPDPAKITVFRGFLKSLGFVLPKEAHRDPRALKAFLEEVQKTPLAPMVLLMLLRSLKQARYAGEALGHYGLATEWYTHFTSPIRRYPDLLVHRLLLAKLAGKKAPVSLEPDDLEATCNHLNKRERLGVEAEREMLARMQVRFLFHRVGETFSGRVTGVNAFGFFVALDEVFAEGLVRLVDLPNDYYRYDEMRMRLTGRKTGSSFALGDQVRVTVAHVDIRRRHVNLILAEEESEPEAVSREPETEKGARPKGRRPGGQRRRGAGKKPKAEAKGEKPA
ncbi:MAG: ribonuclease R [Syntrophobacterales bacterium]|jgi:ribonuclease R|nr:ribonuclease R [Syntrophobacterales bacterium]